MEISHFLLLNENNVIIKIFENFDAYAINFWESV